MLNRREKSREELLKQYEHVMELYKFYWNVSMRVSGFYVITNGAVLAFYVSNQQFDLIYLALGFLIVLATAYFVLCMYGIRALNDINDWFDTISGQNGLNWDYWPSAQPLQVYLVLNALLGLLISGFCLYALSKSLLVAFVVVSILTLVGYILFAHRFPAVFRQLGSKLPTTHYLQTKSQAWRCIQPFTPTGNA